LNIISLVHQLSIQIIQPVIERFETWFKAATKPCSNKLVIGTALDLKRSKSELVAENALLRQQLIVLKRQTKRPELTQRDRLLLVLLARLTRGWKEALLIVQPDTVVKWHHLGFCLFWRRKSRSTTRQPRIPEEAIALIQAMAVENRLWGAKRIRDELEKLGHQVSKRTVAKYMRQARRNLPPRASGQTWTTFIKNHAHEMWACDLIVCSQLTKGNMRAIRTGWHHIAYLHLVVGHNHPVDQQFNQLAFLLKRCLSEYRTDLRAKGFDGGCDLSQLQPLRGRGFQLGALQADRHLFLVKMGALAL
jgi:hypothetical protein